MSDEIASTRPRASPATAGRKAPLRPCSGDEPKVNGRAVSSRSLGSAEMVIRAITEGLYSGRYAPGQRLVEADLTREYGISRGSVREALSRLAADGIVTLNRHRGAQIRSLTRKEALDVLNLLEILVGIRRAKRGSADPNAR